MKVKILILILVVLMVGGSILTIFFSENIKIPIIDSIDKQTYYTSNSNNEVMLYNLDLTPGIKIPRGLEVITTTEVEIINDKEYFKVNYDNKDYYILLTNLSLDKDNIVKEEILYVRTAATLYNSSDSISISGFVDKNDTLEVIGHSEVLDDGSVLMYKVKTDDQEGFIYSKYLVDNKEEASLHYNENGFYDIHSERTNSWLLGGGADNLDYYPREKGDFIDNVMPEDVRSLYIPSGVLYNIDAYINLVKDSNINTFVVDIKDSTVPAYPAKAYETYSPTNYKYAQMSYETYKNAIQKIKDAGLYVVGRISVFKDSYYAVDHPENTIIDNNTGTSLVYNGSKWPSAYSRHVWEYNVALAVESVTEMGFDEIQFDYVRFPDGTISKENSGQLDFNNTYDEEKAQAIQRFLMYATDELHKVNAYVSADVFGEASNAYVTAYGQYWPAISNVVDVISAMPYPDHFNTYEFGYKVPVWTIPYDLLKSWGNIAMQRQEETPTPAKARTWIQAYDAYKTPKVSYDSYMIEQQLKALYEVGLDDGFMPWNASGSLTRWSNLLDAFGKEY